MADLGPRPPGQLGASGRALWRRVVRVYALEEPHHLALLAEAASCMDRLSACREEIARDGLTQTDRFGNLRPHPLLSVERDNKAALAKLLRELNLDGAVVEEVVRPPMIGGRYARQNRSA